MGTPPSPPSLVRHFGIRVEVFQREPDRIHELVTARARLILAVQRHLLAQGHDLVVALGIL